MVMEVRVEQGDGLNSVDEGVFLDLYEDLSYFTVIPNLRDLYGRYCIYVDGMITKLQLSVYLDDYDSNSGNLPDSITEEISQYVGVPIDLNPEDIENILELKNMTYMNKGLQNSPLQEVW